jgi:transposase
VVSGDFYCVYTSADNKADGLVNLFCWAHIRRFFIGAGDANPGQLTYWTQRWLERIMTLYAAHEELTAAREQAAASAPGQAATAAAGLEEARAARGRRHRGDRRRPHEGDGRPGPARAAEEGPGHLDWERDGLIAHRDYPMTGLGNYPDVAVMPKSGLGGVFPLAGAVAWPRSSA